jgi:hypothetical protein
MSVYMEEKTLQFLIYTVRILHLQGTSVKVKTTTELPSDVSAERIQKYAAHFDYCLDCQDSDLGVPRFSEHALLVRQQRLHKFPNIFCLIGYNRKLSRHIKTEKVGR